MRGQHTVRGSHLAILGLAGTVIAGGLIGLVSSASAASCPRSGQTVTCTFDNPEAPETFVVPAGVTSVSITVQGGSGGNGGDPGGTGGAGGVATAVVAVSPGTGLDIFAGGNGVDATGCGAGSVGGAGGSSGGIPTGGDGGDGVTDGSFIGCAAGGGGAGSFVMAGGQSPSQITFDDSDFPNGTLPVLAAGGGGGGGAGAGGLDGGTGGGVTSGPATAGGNSAGGPGNQDEPGGGEGVDALVDFDPPPSWVEDASGGGGGGFRGGDNGLRNGDGGPSGGPGEGGGGGEGYPLPIAPATVPASNRAPSLSARVVGPISPGIAAAGSPGAITITYNAPAPNTPATPVTSDTVNCTPANDPCVAEPPAGEETAFKVVAFGGDEGAQLFAILNGGLPPTCRSVGGDLSPDWVQFGFQDPKDGRTWSKRIRVTGTNPASKDAARRELAQTQICFAAPYKFVVKRGFKLTRPVGSSSWEGLLAHCKSRIVAEAKRDNPDLARPCILNRSLVKKGDGFVVRVNYFVPNGELDPQGRSVKKKKKKRG